MITVNQLKLNINHSKDEFVTKLAKTLRISSDELTGYEIFKRSIDSRDKDNICYVYSVEASVKNEKKTLSLNSRNRNITASKRVEYAFPYSFDKIPDDSDRPVVVGAGPAGLICAYELAGAGLRPIVIERGKPVEERLADVERFWENGMLNTESNVQFGEGGAGTFSDGKLNTRIKDPKGLARYVLKIFTKNGADPDIMYDYHPHIGTDVLVNVVRNIRNEIIKAGGEFRFSTKMTGLEYDETGLNAVITDKVLEHNDAEPKASIADKVLEHNDTEPKASAADTEKIKTSKVILCIGHSARDTFMMLADTGIEIKEKPFACGLRIIHPQRMINESMYGMSSPKTLPSADYKLTHKCDNGRGVYSFCMCPGGYVVNASSENKRLAVNGMSYSGRDGGFANSALIVTVTPDDFRNYEVNGVPSVLNGMNFQRSLEQKAYELCGGRIPVQTYSEFKSCVSNRNGFFVEGDGEDLNKVEESCVSDLSEAPGNGNYIEIDLSDRIKGQYEFGQVSKILPYELNKSLVEAIESFGNQIKGFNNDGALLLGVESRTSSPIRIMRDDNMQCSIRGLYPCGEGAGYAGGIMSAAVDGLKAAEKVCEAYLH